MTLFEAIRRLKEGQAIELVEPPRLVMATWNSGEAGAEIASKVWLDRADKGLESEVRIVDLPEPKITLEDGLRTTLGHAVVYTWGIPDILKKLYSLPIDWQAEADRAKKDSA